MADGRHPGFARMPVKVRQMAKTVIAQPAQRFSLRAHTGAGPLAPHSWVARKMLAHTVAVSLNLSAGRQPLQFEGLLQP